MAMLEQEYNQVRIDLLRTKLKRVNLEINESNKVTETIDNKLLEIRQQIKYQKSQNEKLLFEKKLKLERLQDVI
jgi:hypothetical protein